MRRNLRKLKLRHPLSLALVLSVAFIVPNLRAAILYPQAPPGAEESASNALDSKFLEPTTHLPATRDLSISRPFGVYWYDINFTNPFSGSFLSARTLVGWHFLLSDGTNSAAVQLRYDEDKREWPPLGWTFYCPCPISSDAIRRTLQAMEQLPQVQKQDYELRYLDFMSLKFSAFWLHGKSGDIIMPVADYDKWQDYHIYSEKEVIQILKREVKEMLKRPPQKGPPWRVD
jgi:hypothetical protein